MRREKHCAAQPERRGFPSARAECQSVLQAYYTGSSLPARCHCNSRALDRIAALRYWSRCSGYRISCVIRPNSFDKVSATFETLITRNDALSYRWARTARRCAPERNLLDAPGRGIDGDTHRNVHLCLYAWFVRGANRPAHLRVARGFAIYLLSG